MCGKGYGQCESPEVGKISQGEQRDGHYDQTGKVKKKWEVGKFGETESCWATIKGIFLF